MRLPHRTALRLAFGIITVWLVAMVWLMSVAAERAGPGAPLLVLFPPDLSRQDVIRAIARADVSPARSTIFESAWFIQTTSANGAERLRGQGAFAVFADLPYFPVIAGCMPYNFSAMRQKEHERPR